MFKSVKNTAFAGLPVPAFLLLCVLMLSLLSACQPAPRAPAPPAVSPPSSAPPAAPPLNPPPAGPAATITKWVADGIISAGEYQNTKSFGDYSVNWSSDTEYSYIGMKAKTAGWIAIGFGAETFMKNADIVMGSVKDGALTIADTFSQGEFGPHPPDTQLGGTDDILASAGKLDAGYTTIEFKRKLVTGDKFDRPLVSGINKIIWAYSGESVLSVKHSLRGTAEIELK